MSLGAAHAVASWNALGVKEEGVSPLHATSRPKEKARPGRWGVSAGQTLANLSYLMVTSASIYLIGYSLFSIRFSLLAPRIIFTSHRGCNGVLDDPRDFFSPQCRRFTSTPRF